MYDIDVNGTATVLRAAAETGTQQVLVTDNYIVRAWEKSSFMPIMDGVDEEFQLVHADDVVTAIIGLLDARVGGAFNVAGDGSLRWGESARMIGLKTRADTREVFIETMYARGLTATPPPRVAEAAPTP